MYPGKQGCSSTISTSEKADTTGYSVECKNPTARRMRVEKF